jgi:hypothetical protein
MTARELTAYAECARQAAPELLAALEMALRAFGNPKEIDALVAFATVEKIRAAIAKAKGVKD